MNKPMFKRVEERIARATIKALLAAGYQISVDDGGAYGGGDEFGPYNRPRTVFNHMFSTDSDRLYAWKDWKRIGWVLFVYGNGGWDVINDYTTNLEHVLAPVNELAEGLA